MGGTWQLISGGLEPNEVAWRGALREMREETGLAPREFYQLDTLTSFYRPENDTLNTAPMFCAIVGAEDDAVVNPEHTSLEWVNLDEVEARLMWPSDRAAFQEVRSVILNEGLAKPYMRIPM